MKYSCVGCNADNIFDETLVTDDCIYGVCVDCHSLVEPRFFRTEKQISNLTCAILFGGNYNGIQSED